MSKWIELQKTKLPNWNWLVRLSDISNGGIGVHYLCLCTVSLYSFVKYKVVNSFDRRFIVTLMSPGFNQIVRAVDLLSLLHYVLWLCTSTCMYTEILHSSVLHVLHQRYYKSTWLTQSPFFVNEIHVDRSYYTVNKKQRKRVLGL